MAIKAPWIGVALVMAAGCEETPLSVKVQRLAEEACACPDRRSFEAVIARAGRDPDIARLDDIEYARVAYASDTILLNALQKLAVCRERWAAGVGPPTP